MMAAGAGDRAPLRIATWNADLSRKGPGLLLRDILGDRDPGVAAVVAGLVAVRPDVVLLTRIDLDPDHVALRALIDRLAAAGLDYPHYHAPPQNRGLASGIDLDGNGRLAEAEDAQGYGRFQGDGAMAILSRLPLDPVADHAAFRWRDLPAARLAAVPGPARAVQRLSSSAHWVVAVELPDGGRLHLLAWAATPPLFDTTGRNADRNHDEAAFWLRLLDGELPFAAPAGPLVLLGLANLAPGQGDGAALATLAHHPRLHPPLGLATADLRAGPAALSHLQASRDLRVLAAGIHPPAGILATASGRHRLLWVDLAPVAPP